MSAFNQLMADSLFRSLKFADLALFIRANKIQIVSFNWALCIHNEFVERWRPLSC